MLSLILPIRDWPLERVEASLGSFLALRSQHLSEIVVVDFGSREKVKLPKSLVGKAKLVRVDAQVWSLAEAINVGVVASSGTVLAKIDADTLISPDSKAEFDYTAERAASGDLGLAVAQFIDFQSQVSLEQAVIAAAGAGAAFSRRRPKWGQGALVFFSRAAWLDIGGFDSRYTGWGNEDNDFYERMRRAGHRVAWTDRERLKCYHVWHPPTSAKPGIVAHRKRNMELYKTDKSVFRPVKFIHSNVEKIAAPSVLKSIRPLVTLALATTARPGRLKMIVEALNSFKGQMDSDVEAVIIENGSSPEDFKTLQKKLESVRWPAAVRVERLVEASIPKARNIATDISRGRFICVVDDDDIALPNRLKDHLRVFNSDGTLHGSHGGWIDFDEASGVVERNQGRQRSYAVLMKGSSKASIHPASLYRADVLRSVRYDENFALGSDWDLSLRVAMMGLEFAHTRSFVILRRFHASNVTLTGQSEQASVGLRARSRQLVALGGPKELEALRDLAKTQDGEIYCSNSMSLETVARLMPPYAGEWHIFVPIEAISSGGAAGQSNATVDPKILQRILSKTDGGLVTRLSGQRQPVFFRSKAIKGVARALAVKAELEEFLNSPAELASSLHSELERQQPYDWAAMRAEAGKRFLRSTRFSDCAEALLASLKLAPNPQLQHMVVLISDYDQEGEAYYLMTGALSGRSEIQARRFQLKQATGLDFVELGSGAVVSEVTMGRHG